MTHAIISIVLVAFVTWFVFHDMDETKQQDKTTEQQ